MYLNKLFCIFEHYFNNIDKIFSINFTLLAFIITAITILLMVSKGAIVEFKEAGILNKSLEYFYKSLNFNFISGIFGLLVWVIDNHNIWFISLSSIMSMILVIISLYYTFQSYKFLIFFIKNQ